MIDRKTPASNVERILKLLAPLTSYAAKLFLEEGISRPDDMLPGTGKSARGLAFDALTEFIEGGMTFRARSAKSYQKDLFNYLKTVIRRDFLDLIKSHAYQKTDVIDAATSGEVDVREHVLEEMGDVGAEDGFRSLDAAMTARRVLPLVEDEPELKELIEALLCFESTKREDIAHILGITPQEVTNRTRRLKVRLASWHRSVHARRKVGSTHG